MGSKLHELVNKWNSLSSSKSDRIIMRNGWIRLHHCRWWVCRVCQSLHLFPVRNVKSCTLVHRHSSQPANIFGIVLSYILCSGWHLLALVDHERIDICHLIESVRINHQTEFKIKIQQSPYMHLDLSLKLRQISVL